MSLPGRPFTSVVLAGALLVLAAIVTWAFLAHEKPHPDRLAAAQFQAEADYREAVRFAEHERERCDRAPEAAGCERIPSPRRGEYHWFLPGSFNMHYEFPYMIMFFAMILATAAYPIGAAAAGSGEHYGMTKAVFGTGLAGLLGLLTAISLLLGALWTGAFLLVAEMNGTTDDLTAGAWLSFGLTGLRGLALILAAGAVGFAVTSLGRRTSVGLLALVAAGVVQIGVGMATAVAGIRWQALYLAPMWVGAWMTDAVDMIDPESCDFERVPDCVHDTLTLTRPVAGAVIAALTLAVVGAAAWSAHRRDIG
jgi:ABC-2 type transport system permease protein